MISLEQRAAIVKETMTWLNTPYHHQGAIKGVGVDCAMILIKVYNACGHIPNLDPRPYPMDWHLHRDDERYLGWVKEYADEVAAPLPGDIALFKYGRCISHGAIVIEWPLVAHAVRIERKVILSDISTNADMISRLETFYALRK